MALVDGWPQNGKTVTESRGSSVRQVFLIAQRFVQNTAKRDRVLATSGCSAAGGTLFDGLLFLFSFSHKPAI